MSIFVAFFLGIFIYIAWKDKKVYQEKLKYFVPIRGKIVKKVRREAGAGSSKYVTYHHLIEYFTPDGVKIETVFATNILANNYEVGQTLDLIVDPKNPNNTEMKDNPNVNLNLIIYCVAALVAIPPFLFMDIMLFGTIILSILNGTFSIEAK
jgi:hypothetical protein